MQEIAWGNLQLKIEKFTGLQRAFGPLFGHYIRSIFPRNFMAIIIPKDSEI